MEWDNITHCVKCGVSEVRQRVFFLGDLNGYSDRQKVNNWLREQLLAEVDANDHEQRQKRQVGRSCKFLEAQGTDSGTGLGAVVA